MKTIQLNLYAFGELNETAKETALTDHFEINVDYSWWDNVYNDAKEAGLQINGFDIDYDYHIKAGFMNDAIYTAGQIMDNHGEQTDTYQTTKVFWDKRNKLVGEWPKDGHGELKNAGDLDEAIEEMENGYLKAIGKDYLRLLVMDYDYLTSDEAIADTLTANEYWFTADGKLATRLEKLTA